MFWSYEDQYQNETLGRLRSDSEVSNITEKFLAHGTLLDATNSLFQDGLESSNHTRTLLQDIGDDVAVLRQEFDEIKLVVQEIIEGMENGLRKI